MRQHKPAPDFRLVVCAVDFSKHSAVALRYALALARARRASLAAVFAVDPFLSAAAAAAYDTRALAGTALLELRRFVRSTLGAPAADDVTSHVAVGKAASTVVATAERLGADLIVMGTHGLSGVKKAFFGSTSDAILRRSPMPVLAIPRRCRAPRRSWPHGLAVAALHFSDHVAVDAAAATDAARSFGAALDVVVAVPNVRVPLWLRVNERVINRDRIALAQGWLDRRLTAPQSGAAAGTHVLVGDKTHDIAALAASRDADVLIVAVPAARGLRRFVDGGDAYRLLCIARCPVLLLPIKAHASRSVKPHRPLHDAA